VHTKAHMWGFWKVGGATQTWGLGKNLWNAKDEKNGW